MAIKLKVLGENQTEVEINGKYLLFSYDTLVAAQVNGTYYRTKTKHSKTTTKHVNAWCPASTWQVTDETLEDIVDE
jgi:hypothetical protein